MGIMTKTVVPAVYSREPGGAFTPAAALHQIIDDLGCATPWAMLAFCLVPRPGHAENASCVAVMAGREASPGTPRNIATAVRDYPAFTRETAAAGGGIGEDSPPDDMAADIPFHAGARSHEDFHARAFAKKTAPLNYSVRYETGPPAPAIAMASGGRG
jgi:hypothetical protein